MALLYDNKHLSHWPEIFLYLKRLMMTAIRNNADDTDYAVQYRRSAANKAGDLTVTRSDREQGWCLWEARAGFARCKQARLRHHLLVETVYSEVVAPMLEVMRQELVELIEQGRVGSHRIDNMWSQFFAVRGFMRRCIERELFTTDEVRQWEDWGPTSTS